MRIVGGEWRGRRLRFVAVEGLRPTSDRVRETLFNWLSPVIAGARCLDLFAGSGALGIEALSRGAAEAVFVERHPNAVQCLLKNLQALGAINPRVEQMDALKWLRSGARPFDVVFLDPPFGQGLLAPACLALETGGWLAPAARVYLETMKNEAVTVPDNWEMVRDKAAGRVAYRLAMRRDVPSLRDNSESKSL
ncbi:MAG: 16S rRNA (guanine(966)-N(2))-methyltransferase RsmD [Gammaproteobacteria bacterium]